MLGAGHTKPTRQMFAPNSDPPNQTDWVTLDMNIRASPDVVFDLDRLHFDGKPLPFEPEKFHEIHAYEVLEHIGQQGSFKGFFREFREYWRVLKPGGWMIGTCPTQEHWGWDDPGHTRHISGKTLGFLTREIYILGKTAVSDYREYVEPCWWKLLHSEVRTLRDQNENEFTRFYFGLQKA